MSEKQNHSRKRYDVCELTIPFDSTPNKETVTNILFARLEAINNLVLGIYSINELYLQTLAQIPTIKDPENDL